MEFCWGSHFSLQVNTQDGSSYECLARNWRVVTTIIKINNSHYNAMVRVFFIEMMSKLIKLLRKLRVMVILHRRQMIIELSDWRFRRFRRTFPTLMAAWDGRDRRGRMMNSCVMSQSMRDFTYLHLKNRRKKATLADLVHSGRSGPKWLVFLLTQHGVDDCSRWTRRTRTNDDLLHRESIHEFLPIRT